MSGNSAAIAGGAIYFQPIVTTNANLNVTQNTLKHNRAWGVCDQNIFGTASLNLSQNTFAASSAPQGNALYMDTSLQTQTTVKGSNNAGDWIGLLEAANKLLDSDIVIM